MCYSDQKLYKLIILLISMCVTCQAGSAHPSVMFCVLLSYHRFSFFIYGVVNFVSTEEFEYLCDLSLIRIQNRTRFLC